MNNRKFKKYLSIFFSVFLCFTAVAVPLSGCSGTLRRTFFTADTVCEITLYDGGTEPVLDAAVELCNALSALLDAHAEDSALSKLNTAGGGTALDSRLLEVLKKGLDYSALKNGVFDITIKPVSELWNFGEGVMPTQTALESAVKQVGYQKVTVSGTDVQLHGTQIDLGAIAKGYIADELIDFLSKNGVKSAIVNLGGNVSLLGKNGNRDFSVGIQTPFEQTTCAAVQVSDCSVVTSGIYQRYLERDGTIYHHLLDPKTGMPVQNGLYSVTIIAPRGVDADALSTLCFLLGIEEGMRLIEQTPDTEAVFMDENKELHLTTGLSMDASKNIMLKE